MLSVISTLLCSSRRLLHSHSRSPPLREQLSKQQINKINYLLKLENPWEMFVSHSRQVTMRIHQIICLLMLHSLSLSLWSELNCLGRGHQSTWIPHKTKSISRWTRQSDKTERREWEQLNRTMRGRVKLVDKFQLIFLVVWNNKANRKKVIFQKIIRIFPSDVTPSLSLVVLNKSHLRNLLSAFPVRRDD